MLAILECVQDSKRRVQDCCDDWDNISDVQMAEPFWALQGWVLMPEISKIKAMCHDGCWDSTEEPDDGESAHIISPPSLPHTASPRLSQHCICPTTTALLSWVILFPCRWRV